MACRPPIHLLRRAWGIALGGRAIRWRRTTSRCPASIAMTYAVTGTGYVSQQKLETKMLACNFAGSRPGFRTEPLTTKSAGVHGEPMIEQPNVCYAQTTSKTCPSAYHPSHAVRGGKIAADRRRAPVLLSARKTTGRLSPPIADIRRPRAVSESDLVFDVQCFRNG